MKNTTTLLLLLLASLSLFGCGSSNGYYSSGSDEYDNEDSYSDAAITSENWDCTEDCSGHEAGYSWAEEKGISDPDDCGGNSESFIEGCQAYANEQVQENEVQIEEERDDYYY